MSEKKFKPMLAIDASKKLDEINYPKLCSRKFDGIRCIFHSALNMISRSLKQIANKQLQKKFKHITNFSNVQQVILDGELYNHDVTFQEISRACMTQDFEDEKTKIKLTKLIFNKTKDPDKYGQLTELEKKHLNETQTFFYYDSYVEELLDGIKFYCFEYLDKNVEIKKFKIRQDLLINTTYHLPHLIVVKQKPVYNKEEVKEEFSKALDEGFEGLILRSHNSPYKYSRSTLKEGYILKVKPYETFDAEIVDIKQATIVIPDAEKGINELGYSTTSRKKDDRILIEKACGFIVKYNGHQLTVPLAMTDEQKKEVWKNKESYIGKMIEYKGMNIGSVDVPRHPVMVRFREDRDE